MNCPIKEITACLLEMISLMGKRYVQKEWPSLIPEVSNYLNQGTLENKQLALEAVKKICKKYRYMFRSDALYSEMNYMIKNLSTLLLTNLIAVIQQLQQSGNPPEVVKQLLSISNSILHIFESILSQEELPDFYEENLPQITQACTFLLDANFLQVLPDAKDAVYHFKVRAKVVRLVHLY